MSYDWKDRVAHEPLTLDWFSEIDRRFVHSARYFAHDQSPFDEIIPFPKIAGARVLEVGCGMGLHTELMARAGADVTAIDISPRSVSATQTRLMLKNIDANVVEKDAELIEYENEFDFIWSWGVIHHSARTGRVLHNLFRALKPGGQLSFMVYHLGGMQAYSVIIREYLLGFWNGKDLDEALWNSTDGYLARYFTRDSLANLCKTFFDEVDIKIFGQESDAVPAPAKIRRILMPFFSDQYCRRAVRRRGSFIFVTAFKPQAA